MIVFDGEAKTMQLPADITSFPTSEIYSRWKDWCRLVGNSGFLPAMSSLGGEPLGGDSYIAGYIIVINDWKIKPASGQYNLEIIGNIIAEDGTIPFIPADSGSVNLALRVTGNALAVDSGSNIDVGKITEAVWSYNRG